MSSTARSSGPSTLGRLGSVTDAQSYKNILYLLTAFPLGLVYFTLTIVGISLGAGLAVLGVGLVILFATVVGVRAMAAVERTLANALLGTDLHAPDDIETGAGLLESAKGYLLAESTLRAFGFVFAKFALGILSFVALVTFLGTALELLLLPVAPDGALNVQVFGIHPADLFQTSTQRLAGAVLGACLLVVSVPVLNAVARANATVAEALLGGDSDSSA
jgi:hypothetical protein